MLQGSLLQCSRKKEIKKVGGKDGRKERKKGRGRGRKERRKRGREKVSKYICMSGNYFCKCISL